MVTPTTSAPRSFTANMNYGNVQMSQISESGSISDDAESEPPRAGPNGPGVRSENEAPELNVESISVEDPVIQIETMLRNLGPPPSAKCCIYKVPELLRNMNKQSYSPRVVSIGPFHYGDKRLKPIEALKQRYLKTLVDRSKKEIKEYVELMKRLEKRARKCYAETIGMTSNDFVLMMLVDAGFIIELLLKYKFTGWNNQDGQMLSTPWLKSAIRLDMLLLENQIPFFVLEEIFTIATDTIKVNTLRYLTLNFFKKYDVHNRGEPYGPINHFADLILIMSRPTSARLTRDNTFESAYSATELHQAGVKFKVSSSPCLFDIEFKKGILTIPCFKLNDQTETLIRNLMALELCHYPTNSYIIDYIFFMDYLINTSSDIDILVKHGIIVNWLGESKVAADLFNNLCVNITIDDGNFYFSRICEDLKAYYKVPLHTWLATCTRDYFSSPWKTASTIAAITLLVLTFIQTVFSVLAFITSKPSF